MNLYLFFDVETTGLIKYGTELSDPSQPRICQLAAILTDGQGNAVEEINVLIKPDGWTVPEETSKIHGITTEMCEADGIPMQEALAKFNDMKARCKGRIAFNISFDKQMLLREELAYDIAHADSSHLEQYCAMQMSSKHCKLPPTDRMIAAGRRGNKPPKLQEAYKHFFGEEFQNAHDALADVRATIKVFFKIRELESAQAA